MRQYFAIPLLILAGCEGSSNVQTNPQTNQQALVCSGSDVPIYRNKFVAQAGASGVATPADALAGKISSDAVSSGGGTVSAPVSTASAPGAAPASPPPSTTAEDSAPAGTGGAPGGTSGAGGAGDVNSTITAMDATCGQAQCASGQVAVELPPVIATGAATGAVGTSGPAVGAPAIGVAAPTTDPPVAAADTAPTSSAPAANPSAPTAKLFCTDPPPSCPQGQSPQFTSKKTWECTDCGLVVTYGGIYGNYRRCVNKPHLNCPSGNVPTWVFEDEQWECKTKCDNGQYDQHTVEGTLVCVPC